MNVKNFLSEQTRSISGYKAPSIDVLEVAVEHGFLGSNELGGGFEGPSYGEEDVNWGSSNNGKTITITDFAEE